MDFKQIRQAFETMGTARPSESVTTFTLSKGLGVKVIVGARGDSDLGYDLISAPHLRREWIPERRSNEPRSLRLLVIGDAAFVATVESGLRGWAHARIAAYLPGDIPSYLANSFDLALVDCTRRNASLAVAIERLHAASLPWLGAVPALEGPTRAWLLDRGAADYAVGTEDIGMRLAALVAGFAANRKSNALVIADGSEMRERLSIALTGLGFGTVTRRSGDSGKDVLSPSSGGPRLVLFGPDLGLPKTLEWLERFQCSGAGKTVSIALAPAPFSGDVAAALIKQGAFDVLPPPYAPELLALRVNLAMRTPQLETILRESIGREALTGAS